MWPTEGAEWGSEAEALRSDRMQQTSYLERHYVMKTSKNVFLKKRTIGRNKSGGRDQSGPDLMRGKA